MWIWACGNCGLRRGLASCRTWIGRVGVWGVESSKNKTNKKKSVFFWECGGIKSLNERNKIKGGRIMYR